MADEDTPMEEVITLNCFVHGETMSNIFEITIGNGSIYSLKEAIKEKKTAFADIDADKLTLWKVSIPVDDDTDAVLADLVLENNDEKGIRGLRIPTHRIFDAFEVHSNEFVPGNLHVIVQPPVTAAKRTWTANLLIDQVKSTIYDVINGVSSSLNDRSVDVWYQVEGRYQSLIKGFTGRYTDELLEEIVKKEKLSDVVSQFQAFVKNEESKEEISLRDIEAKLSSNQVLSFKKLVSIFKIRRGNPIIVLLPGYSVKVISKFTERQLLMLRPSSISYASDSQRKKKSKTTTKSTWGRTPVSVVHWQNFIYHARRMASNDTTLQYDEPTFRNFVEISEEEDVRDALRQNVLDVLTDSIGSKQMPKEEFRRHSILEKVQGKPDFIMRAVDRLMLAIEVKTMWVLSVDDIVAMYQDNLTTLDDHFAPLISVINPIKQIYGYMGHNKLQYGILSTYERTWFLWRPQDDPGVLHISNVVKNTDTDPTLLRCFVYIMSLARHNPDSPSPPLSPQPPMDDYEPPDEDDDGDSTYHSPKGSSSRSGRGRQGGNRGGTGKRGGSSNMAKRNQSQMKGNQRAAGNEQLKEVLRLEDFGWDSFDVINVLGYGRCGTVFKAVLRGEEVAFKLCDLWQCPGYEEELLTEVKTYMALEQLQGRTIPKLKGAGYTAGGFFAIATEIMGSPIEVEKLSDQERNEIVNAMSDIHDHGVLHNDICSENILIQRHCDGFKAVFIDFAFSGKASNKEELENEMAILKRMLGLRPIIKK